MAAVGISADLFEDERQSEEPVTSEEISQDDTQSSKFSWYFQLFYHIYKALKFSTGYSSKIFEIMEQIIFALLSHLGTGDTLHEWDQVKDYVTPGPVLISVFKIWFQVHNNLRQSALYILKLYEVVVPLVPGQLPPFFDMDVDTMPVRFMCCYATIHMIGRMPHHTVRFITNIFRRIRSFILNSAEETALEF